MPDNNDFKGFEWLNDEVNPNEEIKASDDFKFDEAPDEVKEPVVEVKDEPIIPEAKETTTEETPENEGETTDEVETETEDEESAVEVIINAGAEKGLFWFDPEKEYSDDPDEMLFEVLEDTIAKREKDKRSKIDPKKLEIIEHLENGGDLEILRQVENAFDYSLVDLDDADTRKQLVTDYLKSQEYTDEEIKEELETLEDLGEDKVLKKAKQAQKFFIKQTEEEKAKLIEEDKKRVASEKKAAETQAKELEKTILSTRKLAGFDLSEQEAKELRDYMFAVDKKTGKTQAQLDAENVDNALAMYFWQMKKFNMKDVERKVKTEVSSNLNKKLSQFTSKTSTTSGKTVKADPVDEIKIPSWF